jgi:hypothetical protein
MNSDLVFLHLDKFGYSSMKLLPGQQKHSIFWKRNSQAPIGFFVFMYKKMRALLTRMASSAPLELDCQAL